MSKLNKVMLIGRVGQDPQISQVGESTKAKFSLATDESYKDKQGNKVEQTAWHNVEFYGSIVPVIQKYVKKGDLLYVEGKLKYSKSEKDGAKRYYTNIIGSSMNMFPKAGNGQNQQTQQTQPQQTQTSEFLPEDDDLLPF